MTLHFFSSFVLVNRNFSYLQEQNLLTITHVNETKRNMFGWKESKCVGKFFLWYWIFPVITWTTTEKEKTATTKLIQHQIKCCLLLLHFSKVQIIISSSSIILNFFKCKCIAHTQKQSWWFGYYCFFLNLWFWWCFFSSFIKFINACIEILTFLPSVVFGDHIHHVGHMHETKRTYAFHLQIHSIDFLF